MKIAGISAALAASLAAGVASADIVTFAFSDLQGSYSSDTRQFNVTAGLSSAGDVSRVASPVGTAHFESGDFGGLAIADVDFNVTLGMPVGNTIAAAGTLTITDADGDTLSGDVTGTFISSGPFIFHNGFLSNVIFTDNGTLDGTFDGTDTGNFSTDFAGFVAPFSGAVIELFMNPFNFFEDDFRTSGIELSGLADAREVPAPSAALALVGTGLMGLRRRRQG